MYALKSAQRLSRAVRVEWEDGVSAQFAYVWLRDNGNRRPSLVHLDLNTKPQEVVHNNDQLSVMWPPFLDSTYSSQFLRAHATIKNVKQHKCDIGKPALSVPWRFQAKPDASDTSHMATIGWGENANELGTIWPHFQRLPTIVSVEALTPHAKVHMVDAVKCLQIMAQAHPEEFAFLVNTPIEYQQGVFKSLHRIANVHEGRVLTTVFNNEMRSAEITTECLEMLYASLKVLGAICYEHLHCTTLEPGQLLVVDNSQTYLGAPAQNNRTLRLRLYD